MKKLIYSLGFIGLVWLPAHAVTVTSLADDGSEGSLRWAVEQTGSTEIDFMPNLGYLQNPAEIRLVKPLIIKRAVTIRGWENECLTLTSIGGTNRHFIVENGYCLSLANLTLTGGCDGDDELGGGSVLVNCGSLYATNCAFVANSATFGGACCVIGSSSASFVDVSFSDNAALSLSGGAVATTGSSRSASPSLRFTNCTFVGNTARNYLGGGVYVSMFGLCNIMNCTFYGNIARKGGAVYANNQDNDASAMRIKSSVLVGNEALYGEGNGIDIYLKTAAFCTNNWCGAVSEEWGSRSADLNAGKTVNETYRTCTPVSIGGGTRRVAMSLTEAVGKIGDQKAVQHLEARVGESYYQTLQEALNAMNAGDTIVLLRDVEISDSALDFKKSGILDGGGHEISVLANSTAQKIDQFLGVPMADPRLITPTRGPRICISGGDITLTNITVRGIGLQTDKFVSVKANTRLTLADGATFGPVAFADGRYETQSGFFVMGEFVVGRGARIHDFTNVDLVVRTLGSFMLDGGIIENCTFAPKVKFLPAKSNAAVQILSDGASGVFLSGAVTNVQGKAVLGEENTTLDIREGVLLDGVIQKGTTVPPPDPVVSAWNAQAAGWQATLEALNLASCLTTNDLADVFTSIARTNATSVAEDRLVAASNLLSVALSYASSTCWSMGSFYQDLGAACAVVNQEKYGEMVYLLSDVRIDETISISGTILVTGGVVPFAKAAQDALKEFPEEERVAIAETVLGRMEPVQSVAARTCSALMVPADTKGFEVTGNLYLDAISLATVDNGVRTQPFVSANGTVVSMATSVAIDQVLNGVPLIDVRSGIAMLFAADLTGNTNHVADVGVVNLASGTSLYVAYETQVIGNFAADRAQNIRMAEGSKILVMETGVSGTIGISGLTAPGTVFGEAIGGVSKRPDDWFRNDADPSAKACFEGTMLMWRPTAIDESDYVALGRLPTVKSGETLTYDGGGRRMIAKVAETDDGQRPFIYVPSNAVVRLSNIEIDGTGAKWYGFARVDPAGTLVLDGITVRGFVGGNFGAVVSSSDANVTILNSTFVNNVSSTGVVLDAVTVNGSFSVLVENTSFVSNKVVALVYSDNVSLRADAHRFLNCSYETPKGGVDFQLSNGETCLGGAFGKGTISAFVLSPVDNISNVVEAAQFVFTNGVPNSVQFDFAVPSLSYGRRIVGNPWGEALPPENVSFVSVGCAAEKGEKDVLVLRGIDNLPTPTSVVEADIMWRMEQKDNREATLVVFEDGVTSRVERVACSKENVVYTLPYESERYGKTNIVDYLLYYDTDTRLLYAPDAQHGGITTYVYTRTGSWAAIGYGKAVPDTTLIKSDGSITVRFGEDDVRILEMLSLTREDIAMILDIFLANTSVGQEYAKENPDDDGKAIVGRLSDDSLKVLGGLFLGSGAGLGFVGVLGGLTASSAIDSIAKKTFNMLSYGKSHAGEGGGDGGGSGGGGSGGNGEGGGNGNNKPESRRGTNNDNKSNDVNDNQVNQEQGDNGQGENGQGEDGPGENNNNNNNNNNNDNSQVQDENPAEGEEVAPGGGGGASSSAKEIFDSALIAKDIADAIRTIITCATSDLAYDGFYYASEDHDEIVSENRENHERSARSGDIVLVLRTCNIPDDTLVENVFVEFNAKMSVLDIFKGILLDDSSTRNLVYSLLGDFANGYALGNFVNVHGWKPSTKACLSAIVSMAVGIISRIVTCTNANGYFDINTACSYRIGKKGNVCFREMHFGSDDDPMQNRTAPLVSVEQGGIAEFRDVKFENYTYNESTGLVHVAYGGVLVLDGADFSACGVAPIVVDYGGKVWVSGNTTVSGIWVEDPASLRIGDGPHGMAAAKSANLENTITVYGLDAEGDVFGYRAFEDAMGWDKMVSGRFGSVLKPTVSGTDVIWTMTDDGKISLKPVFSPSGPFSIRVDDTHVYLFGTIENANADYTYTIEGSPKVTEGYERMGKGMVPNSNGTLVIDSVFDRDNRRFYRVRVIAE